MENDGAFPSRFLVCIYVFCLSFLLPNPEPSSRSGVQNRVSSMQAKWKRHRRGRSTWRYISSKADGAPRQSFLLPLLVQGHGSGNSSKHGSLEEGGGGELGSEAGPWPAAWRVRVRSWSEIGKLEEGREGGGSGHSKRGGKSKARAFPKGTMLQKRARRAVRVVREHSIRMRWVGLCGWVSSAVHLTPWSVKQG